VLPAPTLDELAAGIRARVGPNPAVGRGPYILFLGEGCARAAGAPSREDLARQALTTFEYEPPEVSSRQSNEELFKQFTAHTSGLSQRQFARMLRQLYGGVAVPSFYQDLALLIREQYFPLIVTMNFDTLLEQALAGVGVRTSQYRVTTFGRGRTSTPVESSTPPLTHLVKLHGDLAQDIAYLNPQDIQDALMSSKQWIRSDLAGDIIMVEHQVGGDLIIDHWLAHAPFRELWWVSEAPPAASAEIQAWTDRPVREITGELGKPSVFFSQIALRMFRSPEEDEPAALESVRPKTRGFDAAPVLAPEPGVAQTLQVEIRRNQAVLNNLDQSRLTAQDNPQLLAQIQYQKRRMWRLEDRLRSLPDIQPRMVDSVRSIAQRIRTAPVQEPQNAASDDAAPYPLAAIADYVDRQADAVAHELGSTSPNQLVISASLSATLAVADRLRAEYGDALIHGDQIKQLADLVPTAAGRVML
jgi:hypothetical protein